MDLFQRNFDADTQKTTHSDISATAQATIELKMQLEEARQQGFDAGRTVGKQDAQSAYDAGEAERFLQERSAIREQLAALILQDAKHQTDTERDIVELFLGITERTIPELLDSFGAALAIEHIRKSVQQVRTDPILTICTSPEMAVILEKEAPDWLVSTSRKAQIDLRSDPEMARGGVLVMWKNGRLEYNLEAACAAVSNALTTAAEQFNEAAQKAG